MSAQVYVRPFNDKDKVERRLMVEWLYASREKNRFDPKLFETDERGNFIRCRILTCFDESGIVGFIPVTVAILLESLAFRPGLSPVTEARALQAMQHWLVHRASQQNISDAYFVTCDATVLEFAERYGWKKPDVPMMNLHLADLEPKDGRTEPSIEG